MLSVPRTKFQLEWMLLLLGVALRLRQYFTGRSLWADEAMLALNIVQRDFAGLFQPLDYDQGAPLGFLFVEKLINTLLGRHELVLRLFPFLAGLASLGLFHRFAKKSLHGTGYYLALALFAVNPALVYYSSEAKQYIVDVAAAIGLILLAIPALEEKPHRTVFLRLIAAGVFALWFSHPALFVLAGIGATLLIKYLQKQDSGNLWAVSWTGLVWLVNLALLYLINLQHLRRNDYLANYWADGFIPMPPWSNPGWFVTYLRESVAYQFEISFLPMIVPALILAGWLALWRERRGLAAVLALSVLFGGVASALRLYPVSGRLGLFLVPFGILLLGKSVEWVQTLRMQKWMTFAISVILGGYLLGSALAVSVQNFIAPKYYEHIRPTMQVLSESWKDGDALFVTAWAEPAFRFYAPFYGLEGITIASTRIEDYPDAEKIMSRIHPLVGEKRVWVLFSHVYERDGFNEREFIAAYLDQIGEKRREILKPGTSVYLYFYDLSR